MCGGDLLLLLPTDHVEKRHVKMGVSMLANKDCMEEGAEAQFPVMCTAVRSEFFLLNKFHAGGSI